MLGRWPAGLAKCCPADGANPDKYGGIRVRRPRPPAGSAEVASRKRFRSDAPARPYEHQMRRFGCCPPALSQSNSAENYGTVSRTSAKRAAQRRGAPVGASVTKVAANPLASGDGESTTEEEIANALSQGMKLTAPGQSSPPSSPVTDPAVGAPRTPRETPESLRGRTVIILDWDDTLLTTTRLTAKYRVYGPGGEFNPIIAHLWQLCPGECSACILSVVHGGRFEAATASASS